MMFIKTPIMMKRRSVPAHMVIVCLLSACNPAPDGAAGRADGEQADLEQNVTKLKSQMQDAMADIQRQEAELGWLRAELEACRGASERLKGDLEAMNAEIAGNKESVRARGFVLVDRNGQEKARMVVNAEGHPYFSMASLDLLRLDAARSGSLTPNEMASLDGWEARWGAPAMGADPQHFAQGIGHIADGRPVAAGFFLNLFRDDEAYRYQMTVGAPEGVNAAMRATVGPGTDTAVVSSSSGSNLPSADVFAFSLDDGTSWSSLSANDGAGRKAQIRATFSPQSADLPAEGPTIEILDSPAWASKGGATSPVGVEPTFRLWSLGGAATLRLGALNEGSPPRLDSRGNSYYPVFGAITLKSTPGVGPFMLLEDLIGHASLLLDPEVVSFLGWRNIVKKEIK